MFIRQLDLLPEPYSTILDYVNQIQLGQSTLSHAIQWLTQTPQVPSQNRNGSDDAKRVASELRLLLLTKITATQDEDERKRLYQALLLLARFFPLNPTGYPLSDCSSPRIECPLTQAPIDINSPFVFVAADGTWFSLPALFEHLKSRADNPQTRDFFFREDLQRIQLLQQEQYNVYFYSFFQAGISVGFWALMTLSGSTVTLALISQCVLPCLMWAVFALSYSALFGDGLNHNDTPYVSMFKPCVFHFLNTVMGSVAAVTLMCVSQQSISQILLMMFGAGLTGGMGSLMVGVILLRPLLNYLTYPKDPVISKKDERALNAFKPVTVDKLSNTSPFISRALEGFRRLNLFASCTPHPIDYDRPMRGPRPVLNSR